MSIHKLNELGRLEMRRTQNLSKLDPNRIYRMKKMELAQTQHGPRIIGYIDDVEINKVYFPPRFGIYYSRKENEAELKETQEETSKGDTYFKYLGGPQQKLSFYTREQVMGMRQIEQRAQLLSLPPAFQFAQPMPHQPPSSADVVNPLEGEDVVDHHSEVQSIAVPVIDAPSFQSPHTASELLNGNPNGFTLSQLFQESQDLGNLVFEDIVFEELDQQASTSNFEPNISYPQEKKKKAKLKLKVILN